MRPLMRSVDGNCHNERCPALSLLPDIEKNEDKTSSEVSQVDPIPANDMHTDRSVDPAPLITTAEEAGTACAIESSADGIIGETDVKETYEDAAGSFRAAPAEAEAPALHEEFVAEAAASEAYEAEPDACRDEIDLSAPTDDMRYLSDDPSAAMEGYTEDAPGCESAIVTAAVDEPDPIVEDRHIEAAALHPLPDVASFAMRAEEFDECDFEVRGLLSFRKWWYLRQVGISVNGKLLEGIPAFIRENTLRVIGEEFDYFVPMRNVDYIRTPDGLRSIDDEFENCRFK